MPFTRYSFIFMTSLFCVAGCLWLHCSLRLAFSSVTTTGVFRWHGCWGSCYSELSATVQVSVQRRSSVLVLSAPFTRLMWIVPCVWRVSGQRLNNAEGGWCCRLVAPAPSVSSPEREGGELRLEKEWLCVPWEQTSILLEVTHSATLLAKHESNYGGYLGCGCSLFELSAGKQTENFVAVNIRLWKGLVKKSSFFSISAQIIKGRFNFRDNSKCVFIIFSAVYSQRGRSVSRRSYSSTAQHRGCL